MTYIKGIYFCLVVCVAITFLLHALGWVMPFKPTSILITFSQVSVWIMMGMGSVIKVASKEACL